MGVDKEAAARSEAIRVDLTLHMGGRLGGEVLDHTEHGVVILSHNVPYVFSWSELEAGCAYTTRRRLLVAARGDKESLSAEDHFQLGRFARRLGRGDLAATEFRSAIRKDDAYQTRIRGLLDSEKPKKADLRESADPFVPDDTDHADPPASGAGPGRQADARTSASDQRTATDRRVDPAQPLTGPPNVSPPISAANFGQVMGVYRQFGEKVQEVLGKGIVLIETDHFLIWTDWESLHRDRLVQWCESMYAALCEQFSLSPTDQVFLAKCPMFCWQSKSRFRKFAQLFDGYAGSNATGYTRSIERNGHVHVVLLRQGRSPADFDRFAHTLVHEGTHAFLHRLYAPGLVPHWINEGYAELIAERVLGERCPSGENAQLLARQYGRFGWPVGDLLRSVDPLEVHQYPLAHSLVAYLESRGSRRFAGLIKALKQGSTFPDALASHYDGLTVDRLEEQWRQDFDDTASVPEAAQGE